MAQIAAFDEDEGITPTYKDKHGCCSGRPKAPHSHAHVKEHQSRGPDLPPLLNVHLHSPDGPISLSPHPPAFPPPEIPSLSEIAELAGTDCCCGVQCACPGCVQHRGAQHTSPDFKDCKDGCGTCVDHESGVELPATSVFHRVRTGAEPSAPSTSGTPLSRSKYLDAFLACAAQLPPPPSSRNTHLSLDPMNVTVYPSTLFSCNGVENNQARAFGLISVPKLQCGCKGGCGCPEGQCGCGDACKGCCDDGDDGTQSPESSASAQRPALFGVSEEIIRGGGDTVMAS